MMDTARRKQGEGDLRGRLICLVGVMTAVAVTAAAGCSSDGGSTASEDGGLAGMILAESDFPAGSQYFPVPDPQAYGKALDESIRSTTFNPDECREPRVEQARIENTTNRAAANARTENGTVYVTVATKGESESPDLIDRMFFGPCSRIVTDRTINGLHVDTTILESSKLEVPSGLPVDDSIVYQHRVEVHTRLPGDTSPPTTSFRVVGFAWSGEYTVQLEQAVAEQTVESRSEFDALFRAAVERATSGG